MKLKIVFCLLCIFVAGSSAVAQRGAVIRGVVSDELGGIIVGAIVALIDQQGKEQTTVTDASGAFNLSGIAPGTYTLKVTQPDFAEFQQADITLAGVQLRSINVMLRVAALESQVTIDPGATVNLDPSSNKSAFVMKGNDLNALSDDPTELAAELSALAGPAAGPSGAQVFVDGFTAGSGLPDKQSIREIVINQNPFSAEWERIGFGNIQILT
jgi:Carboxypeptidase regulatory-like domain